MKCQKRFPLVMIEWIDSTMRPMGWEFLSEMGKFRAARCVSVGWLIRDGKKAKSLALNIAATDDNDDGVCGVTTIPTCCVKKLTVLQKPAAPAPTLPAGIVVPKAGVDGRVVGGEQLTP